MNVTKPLVGVAALALAGGIALPSVGASGNKYASTESIRDCGNGDTVTLNGPLTLWPPNHKMVGEPVTGVSEGNDGPVTLTLTPSFDEEGLNGSGDPSNLDWSPTDADGNFVATNPDGNTVTAAFELRAERSGRGDGRTYTINWKFESPNGGCASGNDASTTADDPFVITVPHDMGGGAGWK